MNKSTIFLRKLQEMRRDTFSFKPSGPMDPILRYRQIIGEKYDAETKAEFERFIAAFTIRPQT